MRDGTDALQNPGRRQRGRRQSGGAPNDVYVLTVDVARSQWVTAGPFAAMRERNTDPSESGRFRHYG